MQAAGRRGARGQIGVVVARDLVGDARLDCSAVYMSASLPCIRPKVSSDGLALSASFVGVDSWSPLAGSNPALSGGMVGLSAKAWLGMHSTLALGYGQRFGPHGDASVVSLRYAFGF